MTEWSYPVSQEKTRKFGDFHSWWLPNAPIDGEFWSSSSVRAGENYTGFHHRDPDGKYRSGGAWLLNKKEIESYGPDTVTYRSGANIAYTGQYRVSGSALGYSSNYLSASHEDHHNLVMGYAADAYNALKPDHPDFSPAASLFELREMPQLLRRRYKAWARSTRYQPGHKILGEEYLNIWFGWYPLFNDILSFVRAFHQGKKKFNQMLRDEGKPVRRRRNLHKDGIEDITTVPWSTIDHGTAWNPDLEPVHVTQCYGGGNAITSSRVASQTKVWCAGRARYVLPSGPRDDGWRNDMAKRILGLRLTPSAVYNMIPWSWLVDYFTSLGSFMDAISEGIAERVVFDYAYLMHQQISTTEITATQWVWDSPTSQDQVAASRRITETRKTRIAATPFGFGLKHEDLTPMQKSLLGALALSMD